MSTHHYPLGTLSSDYLRVAVGLALTLGPLVMLELATVIAWLLGILAFLFGWFGLRTAMRQASAVEVTPEAIAIRGPFGGALAWNELERMKLAYYAPRSWSTSRRRDPLQERDADDRKRGWLQLTLQGLKGRPIRIESTLEGFDQVLGRALAAARQRELDLDPTTTANLAALGLDHATATPAPIMPAASGSGLARGPGPKGSA